MPEPPQLAPLNTNEQWLYSEPLLDDPEILEMLFLWQKQVVDRIRNEHIRGTMGVRRFGDKFRGRFEIVWTCAGEGQEDDYLLL